MSDSTPRDASVPLSPEDNTIPPEFDPADDTGVMAPPRTLGGILRQLGPGLIIAGSIVGSGELIATTKTGAQAGITLLWLIIIGCIIKVFVQIELGRISITHGETTLAILNRVPGRIGPANWILWFWLAMMAASLAQLGGIVGGVGQSMAISFPISGDYLEAIQTPSARQLSQYLEWDEPLLSTWDLRLLSAAQAEADQNAAADPAAEAASPSPAGYVQQRIEQWIAAQRSVIETRLAELPEDERTALWEEFRAAFPTETTATATELEQLRVPLRARLNRLNAGRIESSQGGVSPERIERGHTVLGEELTVLSMRRPWREVARVVACQHLVREAAAEAQATITDEQQWLAQGELRHARDRVAALTEPSTWDDKWWAAVVTFITIALLYNGRYGIVQHLSTAFVVIFTFITVANVVALQGTEQWRLSTDTILRGLSFGLPESGEGLAMALATFGIIGVGATELITYPYWCIEKGYARYTGWRSDHPAWAERARGWMRVMHWDAFVSMIIYTVATVAFYMMGAAVLYNEGRDPDGMRMVSTLATAYVPVFGEYAGHLFLVGAFAVLYSTFLIANAGHSRMFTDGLKIFGLMDRGSQRAHDRAITTLCIVLPLICLVTFCSGINPVAAVAFAGLMQATMLPMIGFGALYARWTSTDPRLAPPKWWDLLLWLSFVGLLIVGVYAVWSKLMG